MSGSFQPSPLLLLAGPTAVGKSEVALLIAEQIGGEIISVDSMQVYRGLDIGTAKPSAAERQRVPHHLIDLVELTDSFDAARFARCAREVVQAVQARSRVPILCGGTGLYFKAFLEGLGDAPPADASLRVELEATPLAQLLGELERSDPVTFARIDRRNARRVVRALEVIRLTGQPFSVQRAAWTSGGIALSDSPKFFGLTRTSADLQLRIDERVEDMFRRGLVAETEHLLSRGLSQNRTALQAIGYRQVAEFLQGRRSLADTIALVKLRTRQFAKRQMTWFKRQADLTWLSVAPGDHPEMLAAQIAKAVGTRSPGPG